MRKDDKPEIAARGGERPRRNPLASAPAEHRVGIEKYKGRQNKKEKKLERHKLPEKLLAGDAVALSQTDRQDGGVSRPHEHAERAEQEHHRKRERKPGHSVLAAASADVEPVNHGIEGIEAHRHESRPRISEKQRS